MIPINLGTGRRCPIDNMACIDSACNGGKCHIHKIPINPDERTVMSQALWCDKGDHAFSGKDPLKQHFTQTQTVQVNTGDSYGRATYQPREQVTEELDICGRCWTQSNPFQKEENAKPALAQLEEENESYTRGFQAGENHALYTNGHAQD